MKFKIGDPVISIVDTTDDPATSEPGSEQTVAKGFKGTVLSITEGHDYPYHVRQEGGDFCWAFAEEEIEHDQG